tara:strand:+ start:687 stop:1271 length:585 start_codon:yes stop_codon:yes gene_type:complete
MANNNSIEISQLWSEGWYKFAHRLPSENFGPRPEKLLVDLIVIHSISLPPSQFGTNNVERFFTNTLNWQGHPYFKTIEGLRVSSHFFINRLGELKQFVSCNQRAWHAGESKYRGKDQCNDNSIGIELEGTDTDEFEKNQYETLQALTSSILTHYPVNHIAGHEHVSPGRKTDPGIGFDWKHLRRSLGLAKRYFP